MYYLVIFYTSFLLASNNPMELKECEKAVESFISTYSPKDLTYGGEVPTKIGCVDSSYLEGPAKLEL